MPAYITLTYDDAIHFHLDHAMPDLEAHGLRGTFYVSTQQHPEDCWHRRPGDWRAAALRGHSINVTRPNHRAICEYVASRKSDLVCDTFLGVAKGLRQM